LKKFSWYSYIRSNHRLAIKQQLNGQRFIVLILGFERQDYQLGVWH
jgi:hypothetical protein